MISNGFSFFPFLYAVSSSLSSNPKIPFSFDDFAPEVPSCAEPLVRNTAGLATDDERMEGDAARLIEGEFPPGTLPSDVTAISTHTSKRMNWIAISRTKAFREME